MIIIIIIIVEHALCMQLSRNMHFHLNMGKKNTIESKHYETLTFINKIILDEYRRI